MKFSWNISVFLTMLRESKSCTFLRHNLYTHPSARTVCLRTAYKFYSPTCCTASQKVSHWTVDRHRQTRSPERREHKRDEPISRNQSPWRYPRGSGKAHSRDLLRSLYTPHRTRARWNKTKLCWKHSQTHLLHNILHELWFCSRRIRQFR